MKNKETSKRFRVLRLTGDILFWTIVPLSVLFIILTSVFNLPIAGKYRFVVVSDSMVPRIPLHSYITVQKCDISEVAEGDIISFSVDIDSNGKKDTVTHYVARVEIDEVTNEIVIRTHPEGNSALDPWEVRADNLYGKFVSYNLPLGKIMMFTRSIYFVLVLVFVALVYFIEVLLFWWIEKYHPDWLISDKKEQTLQE